MNRLLILSLLGFLCFSNILFAEDLKKIQPQVVPDQLKPTAPRIDPAEKKVVNKRDLDKPLGANLKGIAFFPRPEQVSKRGLVIDKTASTEKYTLILGTALTPSLQDPEFAEQLKPYNNVALTLGVIEKLKAEVISYYRSIDRSYIIVSVPPQDISTGVLQMVVVESRVGQIKVEGNKYFNEDQYLSAFRTKTDDKIHASTLEDDIAWINRNPFRNADVIAEAGKEFGQTDITIVTNERYPLRVYGGVDNYGTDQSGNDRFLAGLNWGNAFGLGHELNYQFTHSVESNYSSSHSASYVIPLPWRHILSFSAAYSKSKPDIVIPFDSEGTSKSVDIAYTVPLKSINNYTHQFSARVPYKSSDNTLDFARIPVTDNETHIVQAEIGYGGEWKFDKQQLGFNITYVHSPGNVTSRNKDRFFRISRAQSDSSYNILRGSIDFTAKLPKNFSWNTRFTAQLASENLLGSEQLNFAGVGAVRGYENGLVYRDSGYVIRNELRAPGFSLLEKLVSPETQKTLPRDQVNLFAFLDTGEGRNKKLQAGEKRSVSLSSIGLGARYHLGQYLSANLEVGWQLDSSPYTTNKKSSQVHLGITLSY